MMFRKRGFAITRQISKKAINSDILSFWDGLAEIIADEILESEKHCEIKNIDESDKIGVSISSGEGK